MDRSERNWFCVTLTAALLWAVAIIDTLAGSW